MSAVVVVGAGIVGSSVAYHLARQGVPVTLLEQGPSLGFGSDGQLFRLDLRVRHQHRDPGRRLRWPCPQRGRHPLHASPLPDPQIAQDIAIAIANATFTARDTELWGESTTTVASDSTHVRAYDQNIFTERHSRYGGRGILIYWHIERGSMVVHSQTLRAGPQRCTR